MPYPAYRKPSPPRPGQRSAAGQLAHPPSVHRQAQGQILRIGVKIVLRLQVAIRILGQIVLKQRQRGEERQQPGAIVEDHLPQLAALAAVQLVAEITLNMHQHVGVVFPRGGPLEEQNIAIGMGPEFRPMLRFYVTGGQVDNEHTAKVDGTSDERLDSLNIGGMFEAWF